MAPRPPEQRVAAYAVILRADQILLSRLAARLTPRELWTLPGGGVEHGEDPRVAVVREVGEETGLVATVGQRASIHAFHQADAWRGGRRADLHAIRIVYDGWVDADAPEPRTVEVGGSTSEAAWHPVTAVLDGTVPTVGLVVEALTEHLPHRRQRISAYALVVREHPESAVLLTRNSTLGPHPGQWQLPGGGVEHGEEPRAAAARETLEETGLEVAMGQVLEVSSTHFEGTAPSGRHEDFHGVGLAFEATALGPETEPTVTLLGDTTDAAAWVPIREVQQGDLDVADLVHAALAARPHP